MRPSGGAVRFCSGFDEALARGGPPAVFLRDRSGEWRFQADWTRDTWGRAPGPHALGQVFTLLRDRDSGFVLIALVTSPTLLAVHPRMDVRSFARLDEAEQALATFGSPPLCAEAW